MIIGILSDSHGDAVTTAQAVAVLESRGATRFVHCGDVCDLRVLDELAGRDAVFVWGNCDEVSATTGRYVAALGLPWPTVPVAFESAGRRVAVFHGHEREFASARRMGAFDYILYGHTHRAADDREGDCRLINPGALYRAKVHTVATLDVTRDEVRFWTLDGEACQL